jgi:hypothetical protein
MLISIGSNVKWDEKVTDIVDMDYTSLSPLSDVVARFNLDFASWHLLV